MQCKINGQPSRDRPRRSAHRDHQVPRGVLGMGSSQGTGRNEEHRLQVTAGPPCPGTCLHLPALSQPEDSLGSSLGDRGPQTPQLAPSDKSDPSHTDPRCDASRGSFPWHLDAGEMPEPPNLPMPWDLSPVTLPGWDSPLSESLWV